MYSYTTGGLMTAKRLKTTNGASQVATLTTNQTYTNEGRINTVTYPSAFDVNGNTIGGPAYTYTYDEVSRPIKLTDSQAVEWVNGIVYGPGNELTHISFSSNGAGGYFSESRTYNSRLQLTRMTVPAGIDMEYRYSSNQNNGQIAQQKDWGSGEEVTYTYDSLSRLISAVTTGPEWGLSFSYDGFGNRTASTVTKGSAPNSALNFDAATNRISTAGFSYDTNGNMTALSGISNVSYDVENRATSMTTGSGVEQYAYAADGKRIWKKMPNGNEEFYFYGITGQKLGTYRAGSGPNGYGMFVLDMNLYFGSKLVRSRGTTVVTDRLGSVRTSGTVTSRYFPYGEEQQVTAQDREKFDGMYRDSTAGFDSASQGYYANTLGRFLTPRSCGSNAGSKDPGSWNRYTFLGGDPVTNSSGLVRIEETGRFDDSISTISRYVPASPRPLPVSAAPPPVALQSAAPNPTPITQPAQSLGDSQTATAGGPGIPGWQMAQLAAQSRSLTAPSINPTTIWTPQTGYIVPGYGASVSAPLTRAVVTSAPVTNDPITPAEILNPMVNLAKFPALA